MYRYIPHFPFSTNDFALLSANRSSISEKNSNRLNSFAISFADKDHQSYTNEMRNKKIKIIIAILQKLLVKKYLPFLKAVRSDAIIHDEMKERAMDKTTWKS